jgi:hypothetical protein
LKIPKIRISYPSTYPAQKSDRGISFFTIFGKDIGYKYPLIYILPMSALYNGGKLTGVVSTAQVGVFWRGYKKTLIFNYIPATLGCSS